MSAASSVVSVAFPMAIPGVYDYAIPDEFCGKVAPGTPVLVALRSRQIWGMAVRVSDHSDFPNLKPVLDIRPLMRGNTFESHISLYEWMARYYQCELGAVFKPFVRKGLMKTSAKTVVRYRRTGHVPDGLTAAQAKACEALQSMTESMTRQELMARCGISDHMIRTLQGKGVLESRTEEVLREADEMAVALTPGAVVLSPEQQHAVDRLRDAFDNPERPFLLHGITGSGKTHVYIDLVKHALARGRGAIILVPEISLTPQTIARFAAEIGDSIAVIHSHMSDGERRDSLSQIMDGHRRVVIGVRSAILAPMPDLGLIVVDEEHDGSYKQSDPEPRYHARDVAIMQGKLQKALVVLGSATPSLESYHNAHDGKYELLELKQRHGNATLPTVTVIDMNGEHEGGNLSFMSRYLYERLRETVLGGRQAILLLNRRGFSTFLICRDCGHTAECPHCSVKLVYHRTDGSLRCHQCGHETPAPSRCPSCRGEHLQYKGTAIQKAEEYLHDQFPRMTIQRMDQDTTRRKGSHVTILEAFGRREIDILLGTQMVSKGLNFPGVALVGVLQADIGLHIPDFRATERTFQLLTQVAGRAGRDDNLGEVVVQTYLPHDRCIRAAATHDYAAFAEEELDARRELGYPPFARLARIIVSDTELQRVLDTATEITDRIIHHASGDVQVLGPSPAVLERVKGRHRYSILLKSPRPSLLNRALQTFARPPVRKNSTLRVAVDVDPANML